MKDDSFSNQINAALDKDGFPENRPIARLYVTELMREARDNGDRDGSIRRQIAEVYEENGLDIND